LRPANDTATNFDFSRYAQFLARGLPRLRIHLPCLPIDGPKGVDDLREALGPLQFVEIFARCLQGSILVDRNQSLTAIALLRLEREAEALKLFSGERRSHERRRLIKLCTNAEQVEPKSTDGELLRKLCADIIGVSKVVLKADIVNKINESVWSAKRNRLSLNPKSRTSLLKL